MSSQVEGSGECDIRFFLWCGGLGTSGDISAVQAETFLINKEFVVTPLPEVERWQAITNMKEWQCGIFQINDGKQEPLTDPIPYALLLNNLATVNTWIISGELNKDGVFHTHAMLKSSVRTDSLRRSMLTAFQNLMLSSHFRKIIGSGTFSFDCLKLQRCHRPSSMCEYMMKNPEWCMSNDERYLQFCYDIDKWNLNERFKKTEPQGEHETSPETNQMTKELIDLIVQSGAKTFEDCLRHGPGIMSKYLHRPGLGSIVQNCLQFVRQTGNLWSINLFDSYEPNPTAIHKILLHQGIMPIDFDNVFFQWITKKHTKKNTICLYGPSNTGKSAFVQGLKSIISWGEITNGQNFMFEGLAETNIGFWEEPLLSAEAAEKAKQVLEGMTCSISIKYKKPFMLPRTPIFITTNHPLWRYCSTEQEALENRMWIFEWNHAVQNMPYTPRAREHRCECCYCQGSCGSTFAIDEPSISGVPESEQSISSGSESAGAQSTATLWTGSMRTAGEGPSRSSSEFSCSSDQQCTNRTEYGSSTSSTDVRYMGQHRIITARNTECGTSTTREHVESEQHRGCDGDVGGRIRTELSSNRRGDGYNRKDDESVLPIPTKRHKTDKIQISAKSKKSRMGKKMDAITITSVMYVPTAEDWKAYLSWLNSTNGR